MARRHDGSYRFSRNPAYVSMLLVCAGILLAEDSAKPLGLLVVFTFVIRYRVVALEERYLERKFGEGYRRYKTGAPRSI